MAEAHSNQKVFLSNENNIRTSFHSKYLEANDHSVQNINVRLRDVIR